MRRSSQVSGVSLALFSIFISMRAPTAQKPTVEPDIHYTLSISHMVFSSDGTLLAASSGWKAEILSTTDRSQLREIKLQTKDSPIVAMQFSADKRVLSAGMMDGKLRKWELASGKELEGFDAVAPSEPPRKYRPMVYASCFSNDGRVFADGFSPGEVDMWDLNSGRKVGEIRTNLGEIRALAFSRDDSQLAVGNSRGAILVWNLRSHDDPKVLESGAPEDKGGWIYWLAFTHDGRRLLSSGFHPGVLLWDMEKVKRVSVIGPDYDWVETFDISSNDSLLVTAGKNGSDRDPDTSVPRSHRIALWEIKTGRQLRVLVGAVALLSPDGSKLAIAEKEEISFAKLPISGH